MLPSDAESHDELMVYLSTRPELTDVLKWWYQHHTTYPTLHRMALDYLSIPGEWSSSFVSLFLTIQIATSIDVERTFSKGQLLLSHVCSRLAVQSTRALLCLGSWSLKGFVKDSDVLSAASQSDLVGEEPDIVLGWDSIKWLHCSLYYLYIYTTWAQVAPAIQWVPIVVPLTRQWPMTHETLNCGCRLVWVWVRVRVTWPTGLPCHCLHTDQNINKMCIILFIVGSAVWLQYITYIRIEYKSTRLMPFL